MPVGVGSPAGRRETHAGPARCLHRPDLAERRGRVRGRAGHRAGPDSRPPGTVIVGARFRPGVGGAALGVPLSELLDQRVEAADLPVVPARRLEGSLPPAEALRRLTEAAAELVTERPPDSLVLAAARWLGLAGGAGGAGRRAAGVSERQLRRRCQAAVGYGPRTLMRVLRFRRFLARIDA